MLHNILSQLVKQIMYDKIQNNWHLFESERQGSLDKTLQEEPETTTENVPIDEVLPEDELNETSGTDATVSPETEVPAASPVKMISWDELKVASGDNPSKCSIVEPKVIKTGKISEDELKVTQKKKKRHRKHKKKCKKTENDATESNPNEPNEPQLTETNDELIKKEQKIVKKAMKKHKKQIQKMKTIGGLPQDFWSKMPQDILKYPFGKDFVQKTARVIHIIEKNHPRVAGGKLSILDMNNEWVKFSPHDSRVPRILIPISDCPPDFVFNPQHYENTLFVAKITEWPETSALPSGQIMKSLGEAGQVEAESHMILSEHDVDDTPFPDEVENDLKERYKSWNIPQAEWSYREDLREECIFTIDPATARDLDDALSIKLLDESSIDGKKLFEVGVHIADVSFFLEECTPLDDVAKHRTTSYYLVQRCIPMLPRLLCEKLCSLNPGEDKLTFSVIWIMDEDAVIRSTRFTRSVIRSCIKLSYQMAQDMIDYPDKKWTHGQLPVIFGKWNYAHVSESVNRLWFLAHQLNKKRFENGSLQMDKVKFIFVLDTRTGLPTGFSSTVRSNSNSLVEEFMLLANMSVGKKIFDEDKIRAVLRSHPPPDLKQLRELKQFCSTRNTEIDTSSSKTLHESLKQLRSQDPVMSRVISHMLLLSMKNAVYINASVLETESDSHHYALSVDCYTHFTSPIRRYPDVLVHRLLASILGYTKRPKLYGDAMDEIIHRCNQCKQGSRLVSEKSQKLFLTLYIKEVGLVEQAVVIKILDRSFDALVFRLGIVVRIYLEKYPVSSFKQMVHNGIPSLEIICQNQAKVFVNVSSLVSLQLFVHPDEMKIEVIF